VGVRWSPLTHSPGQRDSQSGPHDEMMMAQRVCRRWAPLLAAFFTVASSLATSPSSADCAKLLNRTDDVLDDNWWKARRVDLRALKADKPAELVTTVQEMVTTFKQSVVRANCNEVDHKSWAEKELKLIKAGNLPAGSNETWRTTATEKLTHMRDRDHDIFLKHLKMDHAGMGRLTSALGFAKHGVSGPLAGRSKAYQQGLEQALSLCAEALPDGEPPSPAIAIQRLEMLVKALSGVANGPHAPEGTRLIAADAEKTLKEVRGWKDAGKIDIKVKALMKEVNEYKTSLDTRMRKLHDDDSQDRKQFFEVQSNKLFDKLYDIQDLPLAKQVAILAEAPFRDLPVVQALVKNHTEEPLAIQVGRWLDSAKQAMKDRALALRLKRSSSLRNHLAEANPQASNDKVQVLAGIVGQLEGRIESLEGHEKQLQRLDDQNEEAARQKHRLILKAKAKLHTESSALREAISGIEAGKADGLQSAMKVIQSLGL